MMLLIFDLKNHDFYQPRCLNSSMDLDAICQVHLYGPVTHCVRWGSPRGTEDLRVKPAAKTCSCKLRPNRRFRTASWQLQTKNDSAFCQITVVVVYSGPLPSHHLNCAARALC